MIMGTEPTRMFIKGKPMLQHELDTIRKPNNLMVVGMKLKALTEDGRVYVASKEFNQFEKVLNSKGIEFNAFDMSASEVLVVLDIKEEEETE